MKSKPAVGLLVLGAIGIILWSLMTAVGTMVGGGRESFLDWRAENTTVFYGIWLGAVVVVGLPALWFVGKRMGAYAAQQDKAALAARGVGRLASRALRGDKKAIDHLVKLLDDGSPAVRYQSARALALLDDASVDKELFRKVRYWDVEHKLGLIDVLRRTMDLRAIKLLRVLSDDRNHVVARKARTGLTIVSSRSGNIDGIVEKRRRQAKAKQQKQARRAAARTGDGPPNDAIPQHGGTADAVPDRGAASRPADPAAPDRGAAPRPADPATPAD